MRGKNQSDKSGFSFEYLIRVLSGDMLETAWFRAFLFCGTFRTVRVNWDLTDRDAATAGKSKRKESK